LKTNNEPFPIIGKNKPINESFSGVISFEMALLLWANITRRFEEA
jgi:hypothetical protein